MTIAMLGATKKQLQRPEVLRGAYNLEERSSTLVITGDPTGDHWICSILTCLTGAQDVHALVDTTGCRILQRFIHQQANGRCLIFLILLGHMCEKLATEYEIILTVLESIVGLGVSLITTISNHDRRLTLGSQEDVLLQGIDWGTTQALAKLKKMLWGLEALRAFDERLSASLAQIQRAKEAMERNGKKVWRTRRTNL